LSSTASNRGFICGIKKERLAVPFLSNLIDGRDLLDIGICDIGL
jgi:hypothetical protein